MNLKNMSNKMQKVKSQTQRGITLIALVITVIILLILSATAITVGINGGNLFEHARNAREKWDNAVAREEQAINDIWKSYFGTEEEPSQPVAQTARIEVLSNKGNNVKVKMIGNNLADYQFSTDGINWTAAQESDEYTFDVVGDRIIFNNSREFSSSLEEPTVVSGTDTLNVYAKAKSNAGNEVINCTSISVDIPPVIETNDISELEYVNLGNEIEITGYTGTIIDVSSEINIEEMYSSLPQLNIIIPSFINNKLVTKISSNFLAENYSKPSDGARNNGYVCLQNKIDDNIIGSGTAQAIQNGPYDDAIAHALEFENGFSPLFLIPGQTNQVYMLWTCGNLYTFSVTELVPQLNKYYSILFHPTMISTRVVFPPSIAEFIESSLEVSETNRHYNKKYAVIKTNDLQFENDFDNDILQSIKTAVGPNTGSNSLMVEFGSIQSVANSLISNEYVFINKESYEEINNSEILEDYICENTVISYENY